MSFMGIMSKIFSVIGFESDETVQKPAKQKKQKHINTKAKFNFKGKGKNRRVEDIDGIVVFYVENFEGMQKHIQTLQKEEPVIFCLDGCKEDEKKLSLAYLDGAIDMIMGKKVELEKGRFFLFLPQGVEIEE